jgi:hypothetical protein
LEEAGLGGSWRNRPSRGSDPGPAGGGEKWPSQGGSLAAQREAGERPTPGKCCAGPKAVPAQPGERVPA